MTTVKVGDRVTGRPPVDPRSRLRGVLRSERLGLSAALVVLTAYLAFTTPYFFAWDNASNISTAISYTGICAAVSTLVLVGGGVDLSVAAVMAIAGTTAAAMMDAGYPAGVAVLAALVVGTLVGAVNAVLITGVGINPLIATIGTQFAIRGFAYIVIDGRELLIDNSAFLYLGQGRLLGVPVPSLIMVACFLFFGFLMRLTVFGRHVYAIGGSPDGAMARLAGVPVKRRQYQMYIMSGAFASLGGVVLAAYSGSATGNAALGLELPIIAAVILGGTALGGGRGTIIGTVLGVILLGIINNGLTLRSVPHAWLFVVQGCALLLAVVIDERRQRREAR